MTDTPPPARPASPVRKTARRAAQAGVNVIWLVPILALIVTLAVAWNNFSGRGTLIHVSFADATGINPGETALKFREINVGQVEAVRFTDDLTNVIVDIRVDKDIAQYIDDKAEFWLVRPQVTARGVSRLDTVLTGAFIEGYWDASATEPRTDFVGLERAPLTREDADGTWITLAAEDASGLSEGAPIMYRGLPVGRMENLRVSEDGAQALADVFIEAPHNERLTTATAFWDSSGVSFDLKATGVSVNISSLASLLQGGVQFSTIISGGQPVERGHVFVLNPDEDTARANIFAADGMDRARFAILLPEAVRGLEQGADVQFQGLTVGRVTDLAVRVEQGDSDEGQQVFQQAIIDISPARLGLPEGTDAAGATAFLAAEVADGLRARVASAGFLGTSLMVELIRIPDVEPAEIDMAGDPHPILPSVPGNISDLSDTAQGFMARVGQLPIEETLKSAMDMMNSVTAIASSQDTRAIPETLRGAIDETRGTMSDMRGMVGELRESGAVDNLASTLASASETFEALKLAAADAPEMIQQIDEAAAAIDEFAFAEISAQAEGILIDLRAMLGSEDAEQLPRNLSETLDAASGLLNDLRDGNAAGNLNATLDSARVAADEVAASVSNLPDLVNRLQQTAARAESVIAAYGDRSAFNNEAVNMLRELRRAAANFGSLARMIERNPRAFILGR